MTSPTDLRERLQNALGDTYRIERELSGGMSRVFVAEDVKLGRTVVVKVLPADLSGSVNMERFEREVRLSARLQHPHVVPLLAAGSAAGLPYYVMPFVEGESLRARLTREGELPIADVVRILRDVVDALDYAHRHGVVHRDIKPDNILLTDRHAVVTDFGVAKALSDATGEARLTATGIALGTPAYMAPEQIAGEPNVDARADVYALGAMAFEMVTGLPPFRGATTQAVLAAHMTQEPPALGSLRQAVPASLNAVVQRCLAKRPADRPQTAAELLRVFAQQHTADAADQTEPNARRQAPAIRVALLFGLVSVAVLAFVWFLVQSVGLPDWVMQSAIALLVIGLPIMLVTSQRERRHAAGLVATPVGIQRLFTWRRSIQGGIVAFAALGLATMGFMTSRALGVGPGATLVSAGVLTDRERILIADFDNRTADSSLGLTITQLLRIDLAQSPSLQVMEPSQVSDVLIRMERDRATPVTPEIAREVAAREGVKAYLVGDLIPAGNGFVITARLLSTATNDALVSLRQTVASSADLMQSVDRISGKLRERVGESLRSVRADPPLEQVTTSSLSALRLYVEALKVHDTQGADQALAILDQAIAEDTMFAMAWRRYGAWATNPGVGAVVQAKGDSASRRAFELRSRLPERERLIVEGLYHTVVTVDLERAAAAYTAVLEKYPNDMNALNNIGVVYDRLGRTTDALGMYRRAIRVGSTPALTYNNAVRAAGFLGQPELADTLIDQFQQHMPESSYLLEATILVASYTHDFAAIDSIARIMLRRSPSDQFLGYQYLSTTAELRGKIKEAAQQMRNAVRVDGSRGQMSAEEAAMLAELHDLRLAASYGDSTRLLDRVKALARQNRTFTMTRPPLASRWDLLAPLFAELGDSESAAQVLADLADRMAGARYPAAGARIRERMIAAQIATAAGRPDEALGRLREGCSIAPAMSALCERMAFLEVAQAHDRAGRVDSAIAAYRRFLELRGARTVLPPRAFDAATPRIAPGWRRLGELYESKGDRRNALDAYERFIGYWRDADPELQPIVREVRDRSNRLRRATG